MTPNTSETRNDSGAEGKGVQANSRYAPWRDNPDLVMDGSSLVDLSTGYRWKTVNACGSSGPATSSACAYLSSARSLYGLGIAKVVLGRGQLTGQRPAQVTLLEQRVHVECRECRGRTNWSVSGLPEWMPLWWSKNVVRATRAGISIIWRAEQRLDDQATKRAFGVWGDSQINWLREASRLTSSGGSSVDTLTKALLRDRATQPGT